MYWYSEGDCEELVQITARQGEDLRRAIGFPMETDEKSGVQDRCILSAMLCLLPVIASCWCQLSQLIVGFRLFEMESMFSLGVSALFAM